MSNAVLSLKNITRAYEQGSRRLTVLHELNLEIDSGEIVALVGHSGSGKTTLLQVAGLLDKPDTGEVWIAGKNMAQASDKIRTEARLHHIGFIYQLHHLLAEFTACENVAMPQMIAGVDLSTAHARASALLELLHLKDRETHRPGKLSGGEQQRVAIARALANTPKVILADEPTGNLDPETSEHVFGILLDTVRDKGVSMLVATHNMELAKRMDRVVTLGPEIAI